MRHLKIKAGISEDYWSSNMNFFVAEFGVNRSNLLNLSLNMILAKPAAACVSSLGLTYRLKRHVAWIYEGSEGDDDTNLSGGCIY